MPLLTLAYQAPDFGRGLILLTNFGEGLQSAVIVLAALLLALFAARRADSYGVSPLAVGNQLLLGLLIAIPIIYQAATVWLHNGQPPGGRAPLGLWLAIQIGLTLALLAALIGLRWRGLPLLTTLDICAIPVLFGQVVGGWLFALSWPGPGRAGPAPGMASSPAPMLLWDLAALMAILWIERRFRGRMRPGDTLLLCCLFAALGRVGVAGLRSSVL